MKQAFMLVALALVFGACGGEVAAGDSSAADVADPCDGCEDVSACEGDLCAGDDEEPDTALPGADDSGSEDAGPAVCAPDCVDRVCGGDGCGGSCGECGAGLVCNAGVCGLGCSPDPDAPSATWGSSLTETAFDRIETLREAIQAGVTLGGQAYADALSSHLLEQGLGADYEPGFDVWFSLSEEPVDACPFTAHLANTSPAEVPCDYLVDVVQLAALEGLVETLETTPLPGYIEVADDTGEAAFWYEQGAICGVARHLILARADLRDGLVCGVDASGHDNPTPDESAYEKGRVVGARAMAAALNAELESQCITADYPTLSGPIGICNASVSLLDPARLKAETALSSTVSDTPLCAGYEPPDPGATAAYDSATLRYEAGVEAGIEAEHGLAAIKLFQSAPCAVGDPLVVDLDGDGLELVPIHRGVNFDLYGVGSKQATAWVGPDDALLAMDRDQDGAITSGLELFGNIDQRHRDGFAHLATLDDNGDGVVDAADHGYAKLVLWRDDGDGVSRPSELLRLEAVGLSAIPLNGAGVSMRSGDTHISAVVQAGSFLIGDAFFATAPHAASRVGSR